MDAGLSRCLPGADRRKRCQLRDYCQRLALKRRASVEVARQRCREGFRALDGGPGVCHSRRVPRALAPSVPCRARDALREPRPLRRSSWPIPRARDTNALSASGLFRVVVRPSSLPLLQFFDHAKTIALRWHNNASWSNRVEVVEKGTTYNELTGRCCVYPHIINLKTCWQDRCRINGVFLIVPPTGRIIGIIVENDKHRLLRHADAGCTPLHAVNVPGNTTLCP
jgi:hypothetical protein